MKAVAYSTAGPIDREDALLDITLDAAGVVGKEGGQDQKISTSLSWYIFTGRHHLQERAGAGQHYEYDIHIDFAGFSLIKVKEVEANQTKISAYKARNVESIIIRITSAPVIEI